MSRKLNSNEINQLLNAGVDPFSLDMESIGEKPVEYIINSAEFYGRKFDIDENVLIPRIETEQIIEIALRNIEDNEKKHVRFCDVGTGSGAIGITLGLELQKRRILFEAILSDISEKALEVTRNNLDTLFNTKKQNSNLEIINSNLLSSYPEKSLSSFDLIIANLPYIPSSRIDTLQMSVKDYEPHLALDGGEQGIDLIIKLLHQSKQFIAPNGIVLLEVDDTHDEEFIKSISELGEFNIQVIKDLNGKVRFWLAN